MNLVKTITRELALSLIEADNVCFSEGLRVEGAEYVTLLRECEQLTETTAEATAYGKAREARERKDAVDVRVERRLHQNMPNTFRD